ncbi:MAG: ferredoxin reductase family protein [Patescibacteria group bacterium]
MFIKKFLAILALAIHLPIIFYFWLFGSGDLLRSGQSDMMLIALGRISGLLAVLFILLQLIFIGRVKWLEKLFGLDKLSIWHHLNGIFALIFILAHPILLMLGYGQLTGHGFFNQLFEAILNGDDLFGAFVAVLIFLGTVIISATFIRKYLNYEKWHFLHLATYAAILMAFGHQLELGGDFHNQLFVYYWYALYFGVFGQLIWYRFLTPLVNFFKHGFYVDKLEEELPGVLSCYIKGKDLSSFKAQAGQFMIVRFLNQKIWWQAHPFSISCPPSGQYLRLTIKALGDFTKTLKNNLKAGDKVLLDGPHGVFTLKSSKQDKLLFIAGGVGITPIRAVLEEALLAGRQAILLYGNRTATDIIFKTELDKLKQEHQFGLHYIISDDPSWAGEQGRLDLAKISQLAPDAGTREVYLCGPAAMMKSVRQSLAKLKVPKGQIHFEKFSLG